MRNCLLVVLIILFVFTLPTFLFIFNLSEIVTPEFIKKEVIKSGLITEISENYSKDLAESINPDGTINEAVIKSQISRIQNEVIRNSIQENFENNLQAISDPKKTELIFDTSKIKASLPPEVLQVMKESGQEELKEKYVYKIPIPILIYRFAVNNKMLFRLVSLSLVLLNLFLIALLARGWRTKFRSVSLSLLLPGLFVFIPAIIIRFMPIKLPAMGDLPQAFSIITEDLFNVIKVNLSNLYVLEGAIFISAAVLLFGLSFLFKSDIIEPQLREPAKAS